MFYNFHSVNYFWIQKYERGTNKWKYVDVERRLMDGDLIEHFFKDYFDYGNELKGTCLGFRPSFTDKNIVKRVVIDVDSPEVMKKMRTLVLPQWESMGIEWLEEPGRPKDGVLTGAHFSFLTEASQDITKPFLRQLFAEIGEPLLKEDLEFLKKTTVDFDEVYGCNKLKENCRFISGCNLKYGLRADGKYSSSDIVNRGFRSKLIYKGEELPDIVSVIEACIDMKPVTEDFMTKYIKEDYFPKSEDKKKVFEVLWHGEEFKYHPLNLPVPTTHIPAKLRPIVKNCPAISKILNDAYSDKLIQDRGYEHHKGGFALAGLFRWHDTNYESNEGKECYKNILEECRDRPEGDHNWWIGPDKEPKFYIYKCKTYDENFNACKGCPFKGRIESPRAFSYAGSSPISKQPIETTEKLVTIKQIRDRTFPKFKSRVESLVQDPDAKENMLLCSLMGSGKTWAAVDTIADIVKKYGSTVMFSVHDSKAGMAIRSLLEARGVDVFNLASHEAIFGHQATPPKDVSLADYPCPFFKEIQAEKKIGVQSAQFKSEYCESCPLYDTCHYPTQYSQVMDEKYKVVIIQHAHLKCEEIMYRLLEKGFDALFIDETFIEHIFESVKIDPMEIELLQGMGYGWTDRLERWLGGTMKAKGKLEPTKEELEDVHSVFEGWQTANAQNKQWRIPDMVRFYNQHRIVDDISGIQIVHELPNIPVSAFLDATPPKELIKHLTGLDNIVEYGSGEVIDITSIHPDNRRYQIIDMVNSVTQMNKDFFFETIMTKICQIIERDYGYRKVLLTVYGKDRQKIKDFIEERFPILLAAPYTIDIGLMNKGTNKWADFDAQFILAGRYRTGNEYYEDTFKYRSVANWYRAKKNLPLIVNPYPEVTRNTTISRVKKPVQCLMKIKNKARIMQFNDYHYRVAEPVIDGKSCRQTSVHNDYYWFRLLDELDTAEMMQVERIRLNENVGKQIFHVHNRPILKLLITDPIVFSEFLHI